MKDDRYCRHCATALESAMIDGRHRQHCPACGLVVYRNPTPVVLVLVEHGQRLLLVRRAMAPLQGGWAPPGGYVECGESLEEAARREVKEETAVDVEIDGIDSVHSHADVDVIIICCRARWCGGTARAGDDATDIGWYGRGELPVVAPPPLVPVLDHWFHNVIQQATTAWR